MWEHLWLGAGDEGAHLLAHNHPSEVLEVSVDREEVLMNIDTFDDYHRARALVNSGA